MTCSKCNTIITCKTFLEKMAAASACVNLLAPRIVRSTTKFTTNFNFELFFSFYYELSPNFFHFTTNLFRTSPKQGIFELIKYSTQYVPFDSSYTVLKLTILLELTSV